MYVSLDALEQTPIFNELDNRITEKEVTKSLRLLKNGKASGVDLISNEMLKAGSTILLPVLCKIFNLTLSNGHFPSTWAQGHIMSIHKKGDINDPSNYRGITLSSCLGKLFNGVLNSRLYDFLVSRNIIRQEQIGFRKGHRTTDHLFIINNLIKKYKKSRKSLFMCFVDFQKAFDSVWHLGLFTKLKRIGISSRFYSVIKSLYSKSSISVQIGNRLSPYFQSRIGVRQGDNLSPTLFNIFVNDLPPIFDQTCSPASFGDLHLQCLLYADDLVLFSETEEGLQHSLDKLKDYCNLWSLDINVSKTKVMCCGKVSSQRRFFSGTEQLQMVTSYKYLGLELHESGDLQVARKDLSRRALKAFYGISRHFSNNTKVRTLNHLFDHLVKPILLYGSEILGMHHFAVRADKISSSDSDAAKFFKGLKKEFPILLRYLDNDDPLEKVHLRFCKFALGVHSKATNMAVYGELGRYPLLVDQIISVAKYFYHMKFKTENKLLKSFFLNLGAEGSHPLKDNIISFITKINQHFSMWDPSNIKAVGKYILKLGHRLRKNFEAFWYENITTEFTKNKAGGNKLRTYKIFKQNFGFESYLNIANSSLRKEIARFRISAHRLKVETGRFDGKNKYVPPSERLCQNCSLGCVEDEMHFILDCPCYILNRDELFTKITNCNSTFPAYTREQKFVWLLSNEDLNCQKALAEYISESMRLRL